MSASAANGRPETIGKIPLKDLQSALATSGVLLDLGSFRVRVRSLAPEFGRQLAAVYPAFPCASPVDYSDTSIQLRPVTGVRRWLGQLASVEIDGIDAFGPFPREQLLPHFEWAVNWAFANMMNAHLLLHSGAVEIEGKGVLLIAKPGAGKSTLTAGLVARGARLLSDEFGVIRLEDMALLPMVKPIALKNESIRVLLDWSPDARIGPIFHNTRKGDLTHQAAPAASLERIHQPARPRVIIFPQFRAGGERSLLPVSQARAFMELTANSFNYDVLGPSGFETVARLVDGCAFYRFEYAGLQDAVDTVFGLCRASVPRAVQTTS